MDFGMVGTSGSQLAKKFESTRLVNVDNITLKRLMNKPTKIVLALALGIAIGLLFDNNFIF